MCEKVFPLGPQARHYPQPLARPSGRGRAQNGGRAMEGRKVVCWGWHVGERGGGWEAGGGGWSPEQGVGQAGQVPAPVGWDGVWQAQTVGSEWGQHPVQRVLMPPEPEGRMWPYPLSGLGLPGSLSPLSCPGPKTRALELRSSGLWLGSPLAICVSSPCPSAAQAAAWLPSAPQLELAPCSLLLGLGVLVPQGPRVWGSSRLSWGPVLGGM